MARVYQTCPRRSIHRITQTKVDVDNEEKIGQLSSINQIQSKKLAQAGNAFSPWQTTKSSKGGDKL